MQKQAKILEKRCNRAIKRTRVAIKVKTVTFRISIKHKSFLEKYAKSYTNGNLSQAFSKIMQYTFEKGASENGNSKT
jgi:hypothetical protein